MVRFVFNEGGSGCRTENSLEGVRLEARRTAKRLFG